MYFQLIFLDEFSNEIQKKTPPNYYYDSNLKYSNLEEDELGPLPPKWEKAYTENGEVYFIEYVSLCISFYVKPFF